MRAYGTTFQRIGEQFAKGLREWVENLRELAEEQDWSTTENE